MSLAPLRCKLLGGPQDGAWVIVYPVPCNVGGEGFPVTLWFQKQWQGDGHATYSTDPSERFPVPYQLDTSGYHMNTYKHKEQT